nr:hypothetical protein [Tanacetum cinerariifolium]
MAFEQRSSKPGLNSMTSGQISLGLDLTYAPSTITTQQPSEGKSRAVCIAQMIGGLVVATIKDALLLDDAEGVECLSNEEIFVELARMGYEKPSTKLTNQVGDLSTHTTKYTSPALTQKVFANIKRVGKGFSEVEIPLFEGMIVEQQVVEGEANEMHGKDVNAGVAAEGDVTLTRRVEHLGLDKFAQAMEITKLKQRVKKLKRRNKVKVLKLRRLQNVGTTQRIDTSDDTMMDDVSNQGRMIVEIDQDVDDVLEDDKDKDESEPTEVQEVVEVVTTAKLITEVITDASDTITAASTTITAAKARVSAATLTAAPLRVTAAPKAKSKDKGKGILVEEPKPLKKQAQIEQDEKYARELKAELNRNIDWEEVIDHVNKKAKEDPATKEHISEEESIALKRLNETPAEKAAKRKKLDEEIEELKRHLQIVPNEEDDVYTEATPLDLKVPVVDYEIYNGNNKPYYKIKRVDGSHQLYLSFLSLLRKFDREDLEAL